MNKAKMTFRFDQEGRETNSDLGGERKLPYAERPQSVDDSAASSRLYPADMYSVGGSEQWRMINAVEDNSLAEEWRHSSGVSAVSAESWSAPGYWDRGGGKVAPPPQPPQRRGVSGWKLVGAAVGALMTGGLFGYMVLHLFQAPAPGHTEVASLPAWGQTGAGNESTAAAWVPVDIAAQSYYMLQYGVFSSPEKAGQAKSELLQAGTAVGTDSADSYRVFAGISTDKEEAKLLGSRLQSGGIKLYVRQVELPALEKAHYNGDGDTLRSYFTTSNALVQQLCHLSASILSAGQFQSVSTSDMTALNTLHQQWLQQFSVLTPGLSPAGRTLSSELDRSMNGAVTALSEFNKNRSKEHLWEIQSMMMEYIRLQKQLLASLK